MRYMATALIILTGAVILVGCSDSREVQEDTGINVSQVTLPPTISYNQAIQVCNLTNLTHITLKNYDGRWEWSLTFAENGLIYHCRIDAKSGKVISTEGMNLPNLPNIQPPTPIPLKKIKIDEHAAFKAAIKNEEVVKWLTLHKNASIDRISLESSPKVTLWRIAWADESSFAVLMVAVNATSGELISVRGASFGGLK
ncbi:PepSY domain-containing protein [Archaeoglobus veneficus]|uniref:PepSY domain-containing protein n=1 Tax=Archaeoglobus veneficus (strain DSM 11195 / SNP6) TaxID=693661 RepID=F2KNY7_ARCVS|nr:PepSY domain-containing protein [Archaeoglobus veneficus]AEA46295.1 hypothetical protein Arcve_0259 [Archaeoglobus veneficus SNP6]